MQIDQLVQSHIDEIFSYCDITNHDKLSKLMNREYSR